MRFLVMHRTEARWEAGEKPDAALIARVGALMGELARKGMLVAGEGLRSSALGARVLPGGAEEPGPFGASPGVPGGFLILEVPGLDDAMEWAGRIGKIFPEGAVEVRPVNEPWHIGMAPEPPGRTTTRFAALYKDPGAERDGARSGERDAALRGLAAEMKAAGVLRTEVALKPSARGARLRRSRVSYTVTDGPFTEAKELIGGFALLEVVSKAEAVEWALRYGEAVAPEEIDVRELA